MESLRQAQIRRRADGTIDTGFYTARARAMRSADLQRRGQALRRLASACARGLLALFRKPAG